MSQHYNYLTFLLKWQCKISDIVNSRTELHKCKKHFWLKTQITTNWWPKFWSSEANC